MNNEENQSNTLLETLCLNPDLGGEIIHWNKTRIEFQHQRTQENQDDYMRASDELGQALNQWRFQQPELFEQFALWFKSHETEWDGE